MDLSALRTFARVAELASFTRAAEQLGLPKGRVSSAVGQLESELGTRLLQRTTRSVRLTQDGERFLARCNELLADADALEAFFQQAPEQLEGRLRLDMSAGLATTVVIPALPAFLSKHPKLEFELSTTDRRVDLVQEGFDCVLRVGTLPDSGLVGRQLGRLPLVNVASPAYIGRHGMPRSLADLDTHRLIHYSTLPSTGPIGWEYVDGDVSRMRPMTAVVTVNGSEAYRSACLAGLGIIQAPAIGMQPLIDRGELVELMPEHRAAAMPLTLLVAHRRNPSKRLSALIEWLTAVFAPHLVPG